MSKLAMQMQRLAGSLLLVGLLAACVATPPAATEAPLMAADAEAPVTPSAPTTADSIADYPVTELTFAEAGATFFSLVDSAANAAPDGAPEAAPNAAKVRRFVEVVDGAGITWQGERLASPEKVELFLQQAQQNDAVAVRIDGPVDAEVSTMVDLLPVTEPAPLVSPHPEIRFVRARQDGDAWRFDVTLAYPDTGWEDYADGWHVATPAGQILGARVLLHPHENEQPFTRSLSGVQIPPNVDEVVIRSHDLLSGYSPDTLVIPLRASTSSPNYEVIVE